MSGPKSFLQVQENNCYKKEHFYELVFQTLVHR